VSTGLWRIHPSSPQPTCHSLDGYIVIVLWLQRTQSLGAWTRGRVKRGTENANFYSFCQQVGLLHNAASTYPSKSGRVGSDPDGEPRAWDTNIRGRVGVGRSGNNMASISGGSRKSGNEFSGIVLRGFRERGRWKGWERIPLL